MPSVLSPIDANIARSPRSGLGRLAAWCYDHRRRVLLGWLLAVVAIIGLAQWAGSRLDNNFALASSPSQQAQNLLASRFPSQNGDSADVVLRSPRPLDSPANAATIDRLVRSLQPLAHVSGVQTPLAPGPIDPWIPLMMFTIVFGLSMDYEVFLLSRMREEWVRSGDNSRAVANGLATTARVITAAAAIMVCVFGSFVIGDPLRILGVFGLGLAVAVLVDATVVRMVLVPAVMQLLGSANWWLPRRIGRAIPNLAIEPDVDHLARGCLAGARAVSAQVAEWSRRSLPQEASQPWGHDPGSTNGAVKVPDCPDETARA
jgi:uncharacterized membrane protein YdfJ with MMPL/SSD domain